MVGRLRHGKIPSVKAPNDDMLRAAAPNYIELMLREFYLRKGMNVPADCFKILSFLDFGCGVGRVMEAASEMGAARIDGADISQAMLNHAAKSPLLKSGNSFLTTGTDVGDAPAATYDIVCSFL